MRVAVVDDEEIVRKRLRGALHKEGYALETYASGEDFLREFEPSRTDLVFLDMILPGVDGTEVLRQVKAKSPGTEVVVITGHASIDAAIEAIKLGAFHYLSKPLKLDEIRHLAHKALEHKRLVEENRRLKVRIEFRDGWGEMIGISPRIKAVFQVIDKVAPLDCNVLIQGESGTGKELVARSIHRQSPRQDRPFVAFN